MPKGLGPNVVKIEFQQLITGAGSGGSRQTQLVPSSMGSLNSLYTAYELYKFTRLKYRILTNVDGSANSVATAAYYPDVTVTAPASLGAAMENLDAIVRVATQTTPTEWHDVPKERLRGQLAWYKTQADAASSDFEVQGIIQAFSTSATEAVYLLVRGVCAFRNPVDSATALNRLKEIVKEQLRQEMSEASDSDDDPAKDVPIVKPGITSRSVKRMPRN